MREMGDCEITCRDGADLRNDCSSHSKWVSTPGSAEVGSRDGMVAASLRAGCKVRASATGRVTVCLCSKDMLRSIVKLFRLYFLQLVVTYYTPGYLQFTRYLPLQEVRSGSCR